MCGCVSAEYNCVSNVITAHDAVQSPQVGPPAKSASNIDKDRATQHMNNCLFLSPSSPFPLENDLNVSHVNINSITAPNRLDELEQFGNSNNIHVLCLTETKLDDTVNQSLYTMQSFSPPLI